MTDRPNVLIYHVDNLGFGELGCYGGGVLRGADTARIDKFATEGFQLLNYAPEAQCTPSRSALMTGRFSIRSGTHTVMVPTPQGSGIVAWEKTMGDLFAAAGYRTAAYGKWHVGEGDGRWPTDHGFDEWHGIAHSYDEAFWSNDPFYRKGRDPETWILDAKKGESPREVEELTCERCLELDVDYLARALRFIDAAVEAKALFFVYFNPTKMHVPCVPREEFAGQSGNGPWADCLLQLDSDFGALLDHLDALGVGGSNTIVILAGDNGNDDALLHRGHPGFWDGSYFTGTKASLRTPCIARWPGRIAAGKKSNEIMHCVDWLPTLAQMCGLTLPNDRVIDGVDQSAFLAGQQSQSNRDGFLYWNGDKLYGIKWQNFKLVFVQQRYFSDPALPLATPHIVNLIVDPREREAYNPVHFHSWTMSHFVRLFKAFLESLQREGPVPAGAPIDYVPRRAEATPLEQYERLRVLFGLLD